MNLKKFYKNHIYLFHYLVSIPLLVFIVLSLNILTQTPIERVLEVFIASFFFPIPIIIGLLAARFGTTNISEDKYSEIAFFVIWFLVSNALPILNFLTGQQSFNSTVIAAIPITVVFLCNYSIRRIFL